MYGIFVNQDGGVPYADAIVRGYKTVETRQKNMLLPLVGERVAVIRTRRHKRPEVVGYVDIDRYEFCPVTLFEMYRDETLIPPGSARDVRGRGKWFYRLSNPTECAAYPLPENAVRHGRSWCEW